MNKKFRIGKSKSTKCKMELNAIRIAVLFFRLAYSLSISGEVCKRENLKEEKKWTLRKCQRQYLLKTFFFDRFTSVWNERWWLKHFAPIATAVQLIRRSDWMCVRVFWMPQSFQSTMKIEYKSFGKVKLSTEKPHAPSSYGNFNIDRTHKSSRMEKNRWRQIPKVNGTQTKCENAKKRNRYFF